MPDEDIVDLMQRAALGFIGTVQRLGAATMADLHVDDHTAVVRVDQVLHAPQTFAQLGGSSITVQLDAAAPVPAVGQQVVLFADATAFGSSLAVNEVGRVPIEDVMPHVAGAAAAAEPTAPFAGLAAQADAARFRTHADQADAIVVGQVSALGKAGPVRMAEHDPDWWVATIEVQHAEKGDVPAGPLAVLYANSLDVRWRNWPKPKAGQSGLWLLHATDEALRALAPYQLVHQDDVQPTQQLDSLRG